MGISLNILLLIFNFYTKAQFHGYLDEENAEKIFFEVFYFNLDLPRQLIFY